MPIADFDKSSGTFTHTCALCGHTEAGLHLDPGRGHVRVNDEQTALAIRPCPRCASADGEHVQEFVRLNIPSWEAGEGPHPGSLVGTRFANTGGIVTEHVVGYHLDPQRVRQCQLIRAMQRHPALAAHAPLRPDPPHLPR